MSVTNKIKSNPRIKVIASLPGSVYVELVQVTDLHGYEIFQTFTTFAVTTATGFWTSYFTLPDNKAILWSSVLFSVLAFVSGYITYRYREAIYRKSIIQKIAYLDEFQ